MSAETQEHDRGAVYVSDMSCCEPGSALTREERSDAWRVFPYETCDGPPETGVMICASSFATAPDVTLPLDVSGWHEIAIGMWNPHHDYDGGTTVKVKLDNDPCFVRLASPEREIDRRATRLLEAPFRTADLTGRSLVFGKECGPFGKKAHVAYVKLTPLSDEAVAALQADRAQADTRIVCATIDGISFFHHGEYRTREQILELVEPYRHSDVGKVIWAFNYGETTNYPTEVGRYCAAERDDPIESVTVLSPHTAGIKVSTESLRCMAGQGVIPQAVVADRVHDMGMKFDAMFRLAILGELPPFSWMSGGDGFVEKHPEFRQVLADGTPVQKASYAFPEVRDLMLSIIRESAEKFDMDGAVLAFNRGPRFTMYEQPVLDDFRKEFDDDARGVEFDDPRMQQVNVRYLNQFVRDARRVLDEVGEAKGKRIELGAWVYSTIASNRLCGFDVETWMREGLLDSLIAAVGRNVEHMDPEMIAQGNANGCRCMPGIVSWLYDDPIGDALEYLYPEGAKGIVLWDSDHLPLDHWHAFRRLGHRQEYTEAARNRPEPRTVRLKTVAGCNVAEGLAPAAYSGG